MTVGNNNQNRLYSFIKDKCLLVGKKDSPVDPRLVFNFVRWFMKKDNTPEKVEPLVVKNIQVRDLLLQI